VRERERGSEMVFYNPASACEDPGEVKNDDRDRARATSSCDETAAAQTQTSPRTVSIWETSSWFNSSENTTKALAKEGARIWPYRGDAVVANAERPENCDNVGGLVHNRFTERRAQREPLDTNFKNQNSTDSTSKVTTTTKKSFNFAECTSRKCLDQFDFAKKEYLQKRREHVRAKFTFDFERAKWFVNADGREIILEEKEEDEKKTDDDNNQRINNNSNNNNMGIIEEEINNAAMLRIQTIRDLRLKKHLPNHLEAISRLGHNSTMVAAKNSINKSGKITKRAVPAGKAAIMQQENASEEDSSSTLWSRFVLSNNNVVWVDTTNVNIIENYDHAKMFMDSQQVEEVDIRICFFSATKERNGVIDRDAPGPVIDDETFQIFKSDLKKTIEEHEARTSKEEEGGEAMDIDRVQHKNIADKLKGAAQSTEPKTKEEEILREKLKESIREKYNHIEEIAALKARVSELEKMLFLRSSS